MDKKVIRFPTYNVNFGDAWEIVKHRLDDPNIALQSKILAIETVAHMETLNSISKDDLVHCLRWLYENFDFNEVVK